MKHAKHALPWILVLCVLAWLGMVRNTHAARPAQDVNAARPAQDVYAARPAPRALTAEYLTDPVGLGDLAPRLAWKLAFPERGAVQTAYQIQASDDAGLLAEGRAAWDSGRIASDQSTQVPYAGPTLRSGQRVHWRVRAWNGNGEASAWSAPAFFETGVLRPEEWRARWITGDPPAPTTESLPALMLRRGFDVDKPVASARLYATSLGVYEVELNGKNVSDQVLRPGWTSYDSRLQYQAYDVTGLLRRGANALGVTVGDGWYRGNAGPEGRNHYGTRRALLLELRVRYRDGSETVVASDGAWKASTGPVLAADLLNGETYDARREKAGWSLPGYDEAGWSAVALLDHGKDMLVAQVGPPVRRIMEVKPVKILRTPRGDTVFDFGQNLVGWARLRVAGPAGTKVTLRHAEVLDKAGNFYTENLRTAAQTNTYVLKGGGTESWEPRFTFQGFRYVAVAGYPAEPRLDALTAVVVHSDMGTANRWESSHPLLNRLVKNTEWGQRGNFLDLPTDCPQRNERMGWTGDTQVFARTATYNFDVAGFFTKWLRDLAAEQKPDGSVPHAVPALWGRKDSSVDGGAGWGDAATVVPWTVWQAYGDRQLLREQYRSMKAWVDHAARLAPDGVWNTGFQYGDWLAWQASSWEAMGYPGATTGKDLVATAYLAHSADLVRRAAEVLGEREDARRYAALAGRVKRAFNREFVTANGRVGEGTQTAYALALRFGLLPERLRAQAARRLVDDIDERKGHLTTGFLGTPALLFALSDHGQLDAAYGLLTQESYPSWLYPIRMGATTIWEHWDGIKPDGSFQHPEMNSFNHYAYGAVVEWMYAVVAGIDTDPQATGYKRSMIRPRPGGGLTWARASVETPYGTLASGWRADGATMRLDVTIPPNTRSTVVLPGARLRDVRVDGKPLAGAGLGKAVRQGVGGTISVAIDVGAGDYAFSWDAAALTAKLALGASYGLRDTPATLAKDPRAKTVLERFAPDLLRGKPEWLRKKSLLVAARLYPASLPPERMARLGAELAAVPRRQAPGH